VHSQTSGPKQQSLKLAERRRGHELGTHWRGLPGTGQVKPFSALSSAVRKIASRADHECSLSPSGWAGDKAG
jgi:hypothetical protein